MKKVSALLTLSLLFTLHSNAASGFRDILQKQCIDSEGSVIADSGFNYTKVMVNEQVSIMGFLTSVDGCNRGDFVVYLMNGFAQINDEKMTQVAPAQGVENMSKNCRGKTSTVNGAIFQSAQIFANKIILTTEKCAELTLTLQSADEAKKLN